MEVKTQKGVLDNNDNACSYNTNMRSDDIILVMIFISIRFSNISD